MPFGALSDRIGRRGLIIFGLAYLCSCLPRVCACHVRGACLAAVRTVRAVLRFDRRSGASVVLQILPLLPNVEVPLAGTTAPSVSVHCRQVCCSGTSGSTVQPLWPLFGASLACLSALLLAVLVRACYRTGRTVTRSSENFRRYASFSRSSS